MTTINNHLGAAASNRAERRRELKLAKLAAKQPAVSEAPSTTAKFSGWRRVAIIAGGGAIAWSVIATLAIAVGALIGGGQ